MRLKKIILSVLILSSFALAQLQNIVASPEFVKKGIPIVDIRTPAEWRETGIIKGAYTIMFFDERGQYDTDKFVKKLNSVVDTKKPFAIICHTGSRSAMVSNFLANKLGYNVINLKGGMSYLTKMGYKPVKFVK